MENANSDWHLVGNAPVDAGCMLIIDPCCLRDVLFTEDEQVERWYDQAVVNEIDKAKSQHWPVMAPSDDGKTKRIPVGHLIVTGQGDGSYPVEIRYDADGSVAEVRIKFRE